MRERINQGIAEIHKEFEEDVKEAVEKAGSNIKDIENAINNVIEKMEVKNLTSTQINMYCAMCLVEETCTEDKVDFCGKFVSDNGLYLGKDGTIKTDGWGY
jgi:uncharacterized protein YpuA (DUF1002 family)